jgi:CHAT domain-containing protein
MMKKTSLLLSLLILTYSPPAAAQTEQEKAAVRSAVVRLFSAISRRDLEEVRACWSTGTLQTPVFREYLERLKGRFAQKEPLLFSHFEFFRWAKRDTRISVRLRYIQERREEGTEPYLVSQVWDARFVQEGEAWKWELYGVVEFEQALLQRRSSEERRRLMEAEPECVTLGALQSILRLAGQAGQRGDRDEAPRLLAIAFDMAAFAEHPLWHALCHFARGQQAAREGRPDAAYADYRRTIELAQKAGDRRAVMMAMNEAASALLSMGRYDDAARQLQPALEIAGALDDPLPRARILTNLGILYRLMGQPGIALKLYRENLEATKTNADPVGQGRIYLAMGVAYAEQKEYRESVAALEKARALFQSASAWEDQVAALHNLALVYTEEKNYVKALETLRDCEPSKAGARSLRDQARDLLVKTYVCLQADRREEAAEFLRTLTSWEQEIEADQAARAFTYLGQLHMRQHAWEKAAQAFRQAVRYSERLRSGTADPLLRASLLPRFLSPYWGLAECLRLLSDPEPARRFDSFDACDLSRARSLTDLLRGSNSPERRPDDLKQVSREILSSIPDLCLISYFVGEEKTLLYLLTAGKSASDPVRLIIHAIPIARAELERQINAYWQKCQRQEEDYQPHARALYRLLLEPVRTQLNGKRNLIISPDGVLNRLPFHALMDPQGRWTIQSHAISYAPSLASLRLLYAAGDQRQKSWRNAVEGSKRWYALLAMGGVEEDLPEARRELERVAGLFGTGARLYTGSQATRERAITEMEGARFILFSTHGVPNENVPLYSALQFYGQTKEESLLYAEAIRRLKLQAELVTLSACESGVGGAFPGEGVVGLAWALFAAGAPAVIVTQWQIQDDSAAQLTLALHRRLAERKNAPLSRAEALRQAMLSVMQAHPHPYHWAPYFLIGDGR